MMHKGRDPWEISTIIPTTAADPRALRRVRGDEDKALRGSSNSDTPSVSMQKQTQPRAVGKCLQTPFLRL